MENNQFFFLNKSETLEFNVLENQEINHSFLVISNSDINLSVNYNLKENAKVNVKVVALSYENANSKIEFSSHSNSHFAEFLVNATALGLNKSSTSLTARSKVEKSIKQNKVNQRLTGLILSNHAKITGEPILRIDTEEIFAQHALNIGSLNKEEMFYLQSKGISSNQAKRLIIYGLLMDVLKSLDEEKQDKYLKEIEEIMEQNND